MVSVLLFIIYFFLLWKALFQMRFVQTTELNRNTLFLLFCLKIAAGIALGWISVQHSDQGNDYWTLHNYGLEETDLLKENPKEFITSLFYSPYQHFGKFFNSTGSYWNDLKNNLIVKVLALLNLISNKNYYVNSLFFNAFCFLGHVALFKLFYSYFPQKRNNIIIGAFLLPSMLYFSSGIHKDCIVFALMAFYSFSLTQIIQRRTIRHPLILIISSIGILLLRSHFFVALIPASIGLWLKIRYLVKHAFLKTYLISTILIITLTFFPATNPIKILSKKQADFFELPQATSQIPTDTLFPNLQSLIKNTPQAVVHAFAEPLPWRSPGSAVWFMGIEGWAYILLFIYWLFFNKEKWKVHPLLFYSTLLAIPLFLFIGYIVPNVGSIERYRSIIYPFLLLPILCTIKHIKFKNI